MSDLLVVLSASLAVALVASTLYWRRQVRTVQSGLEAAHDWDTTVERPKAATDEVHQYIEQATQKIDGPPEELPDEIERLKETVSDLQQRQEALRQAWIESWVEAREAAALDFDAPQVVSLTVPTGSSETVKAFAREFLTHDDVIGIVTSAEDGSFAVGVGEHAADMFPASDVASDVAEAAGGGGSGGTERLAAGGGADSEMIADAAATVADRIREKRRAPDPE